MHGSLIMLLALGIDARLGWPAVIYARIGHPVTWIGALITALDRHCNRDSDSDTFRRTAGLLSALFVIGVATAAGWLATTLLPDDGFAYLIAAVLAWPLLAARSMYDHVAAVARPLATGDLPAARRAVSMIVGRDPASLDAAGIARATIESLAENTSDGIVAPIVWGAIFGLPGIAAYKAINTLDSMIGHRTPRHEAFGWAAARIDDAANLIPARLTGLLFAASAAWPASTELLVRATRTMLRDARHHRSPNAGWPEAAMAGALGVRLSGPRLYAGEVSVEPWLNGAARDPAATDIDLALALYRRSMVVLAGALTLLSAYLAAQ